jgi:hypothetical protein
VKAFLMSIALLLAVTLAAAVTLGTIQMSAEDTFISKSNVRL